MMCETDKLTTCAHLQSLEKALREAGISVQRDGKSWWGDENSGGWVFFDCVLDQDSLVDRFNLTPPVVYDEYDGRAMGQEAGFECKEHNSAVKGIHPSYAHLSQSSAEFK